MVSNIETTVTEFLENVSNGSKIVEVEGPKKKSKLQSLWSKKREENNNNPNINNQVVIASSPIPEEIKPKSRPYRGRSPNPQINFIRAQREDSLYNLLEFLDNSCKTAGATPVQSKNLSLPKRKQSRDDANALFSSLKNSLGKLPIQSLRNSLICAQLYGPDDFESEDRYSNVVSAQTVSTYPKIEGTGRSGDPICDRFYIHLHTKHSIISVADGCNWGDKPREAAILACNEITNYVSARISACKDIEEIGCILLKAFMRAHNKIISTQEESRDAGTTTVISGALLKLEQAVEGKEWIFVCASVGDCKSFFYSKKEKTFVEITLGNRNNLTDARDCGGRLGPANPTTSNLPDLRNLNVYSAIINEGDTVVIVSDGIHDNLDPQLRGKSPRDLGLDADDWETAETKFPVETRNVKSKFMINEMNAAVNTKSNVNPHHITTSLIKFSQDLTQPCRLYMEQNPGARQPSDYSIYPGKMDHTTCVSITAKTIPQHPFNNLEKIIETPIAYSHFQKFIEGMDLSNAAIFLPEDFLKNTDINQLFIRDLQYLEYIYVNDLSRDDAHFTIETIVTIYQKFLAGDNPIILSKLLHEQLVDVCRAFIETSVLEVEKRIHTLLRHFQQSKWMKFQCFKNIR